MRYHVPGPPQIKLDIYTQAIISYRAGYSGGLPIGSLVQVGDRWRYRRNGQHSRAYATREQAARKLAEFVYGQDAIISFWNEPKTY